MRETQWIEWTRTRLPLPERQALATALTPEQKAHLLEHDCVWIEGTGVLWNPPDGDLRRARFTHGIHFQTKRGTFYIDSEGSAHVDAESGAHELVGRRFDPHASAARSPSLSGST